MGVSVDTTQIGSVGTLIGASLETAGHFMQSAVLDVFAQGLGDHLGALLFAIAGITALFIIAVGGNYKFGLWFFVGGALFWWVIGDRVPSEGARWEFAERTYGKEAIQEATKGVAEDTARVSHFFKIWNEITSGTISSFISVLGLTAKDSDITFISKAERFDALSNLDIADKDLKNFVALTLFNKCAPYFALVRAKEDPAVDQLVREMIETRLTYYQTKAAPVFRFADHPDKIKWLKDTNLWNKVTAIVPNADSPDAAASCDQLWQIDLAVVAAHSDSLIEALVSQGLPGGLTSEQRAQQIAANKNKILEKFQREIKMEDGDVKIHQLSSDAVVVNLVNEITVRVLFKQLTKLDPNLVMRELDQTTSPVVTEAGLNLQTETARQLRLMQESEQYQGKGDFLTGMLSFPYLQGLALYFLAFAFPFFALSLVIPGRHHAFLLWMGLWFWIKSWDLGFAIVMLVDEMLYALMPQGPPLTDELAKDPALALKTILSIDPSYTVHTYYNIIGTCLASVPILTGLLVKRGGGEIVQAISQGFHNFSGRIGEAMATYSRAMKAQSNAGQVQHNIYNATQRALLQALKDPEVLLPLAGKTATRAVSQALDALKRSGDDPKNSKTKAAIDTLAKGLAEAKGTQASKIAISKLKLNLELAAYRESMSYQNRRLASDAVMLKYFQHDWVNKYPIAGVIDLMKNRETLLFGGVVDKGVDGAIKDWGKSIGKPFNSSGGTITVSGGK